MTRRSRSTLRPRWSTPGAAAARTCPTCAALDSFVAHWRWTGDRARDQAELDDVRALRSRLAAVWEMDKDEAADVG